MRSLSLLRMELLLLPFQSLHCFRFYVNQNLVRVAIFGRAVYLLCVRVELAAHYQYVSHFHLYKVVNSLKPLPLFLVSPLSFHSNEQEDL